MPIIQTEQHLTLSGHIVIDETETLYQWLLQHPSSPIVVENISSVHTAIWQVLLMFKPQIELRGNNSQVLTQWLFPELSRKD